MLSRQGELSHDGHTDKQANKHPAERQVITDVGPTIDRHFDAHLARTSASSPRIITLQMQLGLQHDSGFPRL